MPLLPHDLFGTHNRGEEGCKRPLNIESPVGRFLCAWGGKPTEEPASGTNVSSRAIAQVPIIPYTLSIRIMY